MTLDERVRRILANPDRANLAEVDHLIREADQSLEPEPRGLADLRDMRATLESDWIKRLAGLR